jgi:hypothetical protein
MQDAHGKVNPELPWQKQLSTRRRIFAPVNWAFGAEAFVFQVAIQKIKD